MSIENYHIEKVLQRFEEPFVIEHISNTVVIIGFYSKTVADMSLPMWNIVRLHDQDGIVCEERLSNFNFDKIWNDRFTVGNGYFSALPTLLPNTRSLKLDGVNDEVNFGDVHNFDSASAFSIGIFIKPNNVSAQRVIFSKTTTDANVHGFVVYHAADGRITMQMRAPGKNTSFTFASTLTSGEWQSLMFTYDGSQDIDGAMVYLNAIKDVNTPGSSAITNSWLSGQDFVIGARGGNFNLAAKVNNCYIIDKQLSGEEVTEWHNSMYPIMPSEFSAHNNIVSHYRLGDEDSDTTIFDNVGNSDGTLTGVTLGDVYDEEDTP